jgi:hypothetical protein
MRRTLRPMAGLALVALIAAACSSAPASAPSGGAASLDAAGGQAMKFAACMRANGVTQFPDPDASGALSIDAIANRTSIDTNSPAFRQAVTACRDLEPAGFTGATRTPEQQQAALKFAQCVRDNGVKDFPDPGLGDPLIDTNRIPSAGTSAGMSILHAAMKACGAQAAAAGVHP